MTSSQTKLIYPPDYVEVGVRAAANQPVAQSYSDNSLRFNFGSQVVIQPIKDDESPTSVEEVQKLFRDHLPFYFFTAWNPNGEATTYRDNLDYQESLRNSLRAEGITTGGGFARAADGSWLEGWVYTTINVGDERAREIAKFAGQLVAYRWDLEGLHILSTDPDQIADQSFRYRIEVVKEKPCQLQLEPASDLCKSTGGPWVGKSMAMAAVWQAHRNLAIELAGCGVCSVEPAKHGDNSGDAIAVVELALASRFGGYQWGSVKRPTNPGTYNPAVFVL